MSTQHLEAVDFTTSHQRGWTTLQPLEQCRAELQKRSFQVAHSLAGNPLFAVENLIQVAQDASKRHRDLYLDAGSVSINDKWGEIPVPDMPVDQVIRRIQTAGAWIIMKHVEKDPRYKAVLDEFADFVRSIAGEEGARLLCNPEMLVLITSPGRLTPFHFDAEVNFLVQIQGTKDLWVCDPSDRSITTEQEIETYYAVSINAANYKPHAEAKASKYLLRPGDAIHIPSHAAHWVKNHDNISVSLSLNFEWPRWKQADVYQANHYLRRMGLSPNPPGRSAVIDRTKAFLGAASRPVKRWLGK